MTEQLQSLFVAIAIATILIAIFASQDQSRRKQCRESGHLWQNDDRGHYYCARCGTEPHDR